MATPTAKFFYGNSVLRARNYKRTLKGKDDEDVDGWERTVTTTEDMDENDKTSAIHECGTVSCIKGGYGGQSSVEKK